jgi:arylsulfatase A-like enzyme
MASLFTSVYPVNHGVNNGLGYQEGKTIKFQEVFSPDLVTLAETLSGQGYTTFGVASNFHLSEKFGFERGFDYFSCLPFLPADKVNETVYAWEDDIKQAGKFFLWVHYFDPHDPYTAQEPWIRQYAAEVGTQELLDTQARSFKKLEEPNRRSYENVDLLSHSLALYDSEINYVDAHIGTLIERLNLDRNTLVIITSDHGEEFLEHGEGGHGKNLYQETVRVPLVVKLPGHLKGTIPDLPMSLIDVMPTILDMMHVTPPPGILGRSRWQEKKLLRWFRGKVTGRDREYCYAELETNSSLKAIFSPPWKYIYDFKDNTGQLYNIATDPGELYDRGSTETGVGNQLKDQLFRWMETARRYPTTKYGEELSEELKEKLKGLGYL